MEKDLMHRLAPRLERLDKGGYTRRYRREAKEYRSSLHAAVADLLESLGVEHEEHKAVRPGSKVVADFLTDSRAVFVDRELSPGELREVAKSGKKCVMISKSSTRSDRFDSGVRVVEVGDDTEGRLQTIFLDDPSFNFDYAHILPKTEKCSVMHGHTSSALVEITGSTLDGMVVDFNDAKPIIREAISSLDHKLFIRKKYVVGETKTHIDLKFETVHGEFALHVPKETTVLLEGEATVENLTKELLDRIAPKMPGNVEAVGVYVYEGMNKGTHLLARLHTKEAEKGRKR